jgi:transcriptional regulator with XRE-family HTH domain
VSRAYVNKILQGSTNFTIETLVKIGIALGSQFKFEFVEEDSKEDIPEAEAVDLFELSSVS